MYQKLTTVKLYDENLFYIKMETDKSKPEKNFDFGVGFMKKTVI